MDIFEMPGDCDQSMKQIVAMYKTSYSGENR